MPSCNTSKEIVTGLTSDVKNQLDRLTRSHEAARALLRDFQEVATAVFAANNVPATFVAWNPADQLAGQIDDVMPPKFDGIRFARLDVATPIAGRFARFVFFAATVETGSGLNTSLQCLRFIGKGVHIEAISTENFKPTLKRILLACANASRGNGLPSPF